MPDDKASQFIYKVNPVDFKQILENLVKEGHAERTGKNSYDLTQHGMVLYISHRYQMIRGELNEIYVDLVRLSRHELSEVIRLNVPSKSVTTDIAELIKKIQNCADGIEKTE